jgi:hypothetical protein
MASRTTKRSEGGSRQGRSKSAGTPAHENGNARDKGLTAAEAVDQARAQLSELLGRPVESVLGVERHEGDWVVAAEVLELARVPNTTDVLGLYRAELDRDGEMLGFKQVRRYHRGHTGGDDS